LIVDPTTTSAARTDCSQPSHGEAPVSVNFMVTSSPGFAAVESIR